MISKKLLEAVCPNTERYTYRIAVAYGKSTVEAIDHKWQGMIGTVNIYEVTHKCKEWAYEQGYGVETILMSHKGNQQGRAEIWTNRGAVTTCDTVTGSFIAETESQAIFLACEFILEELENEKR